MTFPSRSVGVVGLIIGLVVSVMHSSEGATRSTTVSARGAEVRLAGSANPAQQPFGRFRGFGNDEDVPLVAMFDTDKDGQLNAEERRAARAHAESLGLQFGRGGRRGALASGQPGPNVRPEAVHKYPASVPFYDEASLRTLFLEFDAPDWEKELMAFKRTDVRVPARLTVDGNAYRGVGVQFHGNSSFSSVPEGLKHSMSIEVDFTDEDQRLSDLRELLLLNSFDDPSLVRAVLFLHVARQYIAAPRANFVRLVINGESWGIYPNVQHFNRDFARDWFDGDRGARWKVPGTLNGRGGLSYLGDDIDAYRGAYEIKSADRPESWAALLRLIKVLDATPLDQLESALAPLLDIDATLRFLALENALVNNDGYWTRASDFNLYLDERGMFHLVPYDVNETFAEGGARGFGQRGGPELDPLSGANDTSKPLRSRLLAVPALRDRYLRYVREIATTWLDWERIGPLVAGYQALIRGDIATDTRKLDSTDAFEAADERLREFAERRRMVLLDATAEVR